MIFIEAGQYWFGFKEGLIDGEDKYTSANMGLYAGSCIYGFM